MPILEQTQPGRKYEGEERRSSQRRRVLFGATLSFNGGYSAFECVVRNVSEGGARLSLAETIGLPATFQLTSGGVGERRTVHAVWRKSDAIGVRFEAQ
jgi:hypothetical protein